MKAPRWAVLWGTIALLLTLSPGAKAFHFPWDQGHDTFQPDDDDDDNECEDTCERCNSNPSPYVAASGAYTTYRNDISIAGLVPLEITRTYHSRDRHNGMFGYGWMFNYGVRLIEVTDGVESAVIVRHADGRRDRFSVLDDGTIANTPDVYDELSRNQDGSWSLRQKEGTVFTFDVVGVLQSITDRNGNALRLSYDAVGALSAITDDAGRALTISKAANGKIGAITDPGGRTTTYGYDAGGRLTSVTDATGAATLYTYDAVGNLTSVIDADGDLIASAAYEPGGRLQSYMEDGKLYNLTHFPLDRRVVETDTRGLTRTILYNENGNITSKTDYIGSVELFEFDASFSPVRLVDKNGNARTQSYDTFGNITTSVDAAGNVTTYSYEPEFNRVIEIVEVGRTTQFQYDDRGNLTQETVNVGSTTRITSYAYDGRGQLISMDGPQPGSVDVTTYTYDQYGNVASITDPLGRSTAMTYDVTSQLLRVEQPSQVVSNYTYDGVGRELSRDVAGEVTLSTYTASGFLESVTFPNGLVTSYQYDPFGRLTQVTHNDGTAIRRTLDARGNVVLEETLASDGSVTQTRAFEYDVIDRLVREIGAAGQVTSYQYDGNGNRILVTDAIGGIVQNSYDPLNRLVATTDPNGGFTVYDYDPLGNLVSVTDPLGHQTLYGVDGFGNQLTLDSPEAGLETRTFDAAGNVATETDARGATTSHEYNALNLLTRSVHSDGSAEVRTYTPGTDDSDLLASITDGDTSLSWNYDAKGRPAQFTQTTQGAQTAQSVTLSQQYVYDAAGRHVQFVYPSGRTLGLGYDVAGNLNRLELDGQPLLSDVRYNPFGQPVAWVWGNGTSYEREFDLDGQLVQFPLGSATESYAYDARGRISSRSGVLSESYTYDALDRLISVTSAPRTQVYGYDVIGNRTNVTLDGQVTTYGYDATSSRLVSRSGGAAASYVYDDAGNLLSDGTRAFAYDPQGRMSQVTVAGSTTRYAYNGLGQRVSKTLPNSTSLAEVYTYDEAGHLLGVYDDAGVPLLEVVYLHDIPIVAVPASGTPHFVYADQLGTPRAITNQSNTVVWSWEADPFGVGAPNSDVDADGTAFAFNLRFPGQYFDAESGLHYNYFRDYDPSLGRYIETDPIGLLGGLNLYLYANANPLSYSDPTGEIAPAAAIAIRIAIAAAWRALQRAIQRCAGNPVCRCRAFYAAYKAMCGIPCTGCSVPSPACCAITAAQAAAAAACVTLRGAYIASKCDIHIPTTKDHPGALAQAERALANCSAKAANMCKCSL